MRITTILTSLCALTLVLPACGGEARKPDAKPAAPKAATVDTKKLEAAKPEPKPEPSATPGQPAEKAPPPDPSVEKIQTAVKVAREISADPEHADDVLARHGLDRDKLDALMFEIAADPELTDAYMAARRAS